jgi:hypothetical protein
VVGKSGLERVKDQHKRREQENHNVDIGSESVKAIQICIHIDCVPSGHAAEVQEHLTFC